VAEQSFQLNASAVVDDLYVALEKVLKKHGVAYGQPGPGDDNWGDDCACLYQSLEEAVVYAARVMRPIAKVHQGKTVEVVNTIEQPLLSDGGQADG